MVTLVTVSRTQPMAIPLPVKLQTLLEDYDLTTTLVINQTANLVVTDLRFEQMLAPSYIVGTVMPPDRLHSGYVYGSSGKHPSSDLPGKLVQIFADPDQLTKMHRAQKVYLHRVTCECNQPIQLKVTPTSLIIPMNADYKKCAHTHTWMVEQYCGGFGGWQFAIKHLENIESLP